MYKEKREIKKQATKAVIVVGMKECDIRLHQRSDIYIIIDYNSRCIQPVQSHQLYNLGYFNNIIIITIQL